MSLLHIFSISKAWNELYNPRKKRKTSHKPLAPMDGWGIKDLHKYGEEMSKNSSIPSQEQQENKWAEWLGRGEREGDKGAKAFCPGWRHQPGQKGSFCPGWWFQPGQKAPVPPLARLAVGPGTKATYCPGPKGCRDKWPGTKACSVVVVALQIKETTI